jgi:hypothetical protein
MDIVTFFDMLGIDPGSGTPDPAAVSKAAALWPNQIVSRTGGFSATDDSSDTSAIVLFLQGQTGGRTVQFSNVRAGVDGTVSVGSGTGQITVAADVQVIVNNIDAQANTFYFRQLPDIGVTLYSTKPGAPARCFFAKDSRGWELILEALPVILTLKAGLVEPMDPSMPSDGDDPLQFNPDEADCLISVRNQNPQPTQIYTSVRIHIRPAGDVILETNIPLSQPSSRFLGLPVKALYELLLIPAPQNREFYEWARNDLSNFLAPVPVGGAIGFRSVDFDLSQPPFSDLVTSLQSGALHTDTMELVCENVVFPLSLGLPLPSHGTLGFRRKIVDRASLANAFSFAGAPVVLLLYPRPSTSPGNAAMLQFGQRGLYLTIDQIFLQSGEPPVVEFQATFVWQSGGTGFLNPGTPVGGTIAIADDWTLQLGISLGDESPAKFTVVDTTVSIVALKVGIGIGRMLKGTPWEQSWQLLGDLGIKGNPTGGSSSIFRLRSLTGKPLSLVLRDIGYSFGHKSIDGLTFPEGVQLIICDTFRLIIEDLGWVEEPNATSYFSFSGGIGIGFGGGDAIKPSGTPNYGTPTDANQNRNGTSDGLAIEVRRLRFNTDDPSPYPFWKVDGISLSLKYKNVLISGFGLLSDEQSNGWQIHELGFGVQAQANILSTNWNLAAQFFKGHRYLIADPSTAFDYFLAGLTVGYLPAGSVGLYAVRFLMANNMTPATDPNATDGQGMALYKWHKDHDTAIDMPRDRNLGDWNAVDNTLAFGMGCGFSFNGCGNALHVNIFVFYSQSDVERGLLVVGELFLLKNPNPLAFLAIEYDLDTNKFGILAGINLKLSDFVSAKATIPSWLNNLVAITGNVYFGNQPWMFALGQLADPRTWPSISVKFSGFNFVLAVCFEWVDGGPKGFGILFTISFNFKWHIGQVSIFGSVGIAIGNWKTGSDATGFEALAQLGFKIYLFSILHIGLDVTIKYAYLGENPWYKSYSLTLTIDTPWWMPNVSFSLDKTWNQQQPYDVPLLPPALSNASTIGLKSASEIALFAPPLSDGNTDAAQLYSFNNLVSVSGVPLGDVHLRTDIPILATDATVALNFTNPVSNDMGVAADTFGSAGDAGVQQVKDITLRYGLKNIAVRRSPRYGAGAGTWTDFVAQTDTALDLSGTLHLAPALSFRWDADSRAEGSLSPKRLLLNSSTPFTVSSGASQNDEEALRNDPGYPCCNPGSAYKQYYPKPHVLSFSNAVVGTRLQVRQQFSAQGVWWQWTTAPLPLATTGITASTSASTVAMMRPSSAGVLGNADLSDAAINASCSLSWGAAANVNVYFEGYFGLKLVAQQHASLATAGNARLQLNAPQDQAMTRILLRIEQPPSTPAYPLQIEEIDYVTAAENALFVGRVARCGSAATTGGKLAFLPNYDYEISVTTEAKVSTANQGERSTNLTELVYFRTKGLPGLNSVANVGDEIEPYIESLYPPAAAVLLYREEPVAVSFTEGMSSILPVDRVSAPTDPPEKTQTMELVLNIDRVGSTKGLVRLTVPSPDWIDAHRAVPQTRLFPRAIVDGADVKNSVRKAVSFDPIVMRYVALQSVSTTCNVNPLRSSQVLIHEPLGENNAAGPWEPQTMLRATVRQKNGPYTQRIAFDLMDSGAFISQADGAASAAGAWTVDANQALVAPAAGAGRQYACFGDLDWNHLQAQAQFDPQGAPAGIAIGVAGGAPVPQAVLATVEPDGSGQALVLRSLVAGIETELGRVAIAATGVVGLAVFAFDDTVRAVVGQAVVEAPRWAVREGRVALVANGPAKFSALAVDGLDLYRFDFATSRYQSFAEHIQSWDGTLVQLAQGDSGVAATPLATLLASDASAISAAMTEAADPQARQALFTKWVTSLGLPLRQQPAALSLCRWTATDGTEALLLESPEPISFSRDVTVALVQHLPPPVWTPIGPGNLQAALMHLQFSGTLVSVSQAFALFAPGDLIVRIAQLGTGPVFAIYTAPQRGMFVVTPGKLQETIAPKLGAQPALDPLRHFPDGTIALIRNKQLLAAVDPKITTAPVNVTIPLVLLSNGPETAALMIPATTAGALAPLSSGRFSLNFALSRQRWRDTSSTDPECLYSQQQSLDLSW